uniref:Uncharacterized protein n=1 Tax=Dechloromonas aromatica (strain RCB) TaxID=159087 RepID=Q478U0_DECAR
MAKLAMGGSKSAKLKGVASRTSAAPLVSGVGQLPAAYGVSPPSCLAAGAWVAYRDQFLDSSAQAQISEIRKGAPASNPVGVAEALHPGFIELEFAVVCPFVFDQRLQPLAA